MYDAYKRLSVKFFGSLADKCIDKFRGLKKSLVGSYIQVLLRTWVSIIFFSTVVSYIASFVVLYIILTMFAAKGAIFINTIIFAPILIASLTFLMLYIYPIQKCKGIKKSIEINLPFALAHMNAVISSGIPPEFMFELLTGLEEYGEVANQSRLIVRNIKTFGMSSISAINDVAEKTPSEEFKNILTGISRTIEKGGRLEDYVNHLADRAIFNYRIKREKYLKTLSTYADIYTALLVAAPLMMLALLGIMGMIGGTIMGLTTNQLIVLMTWMVLPVLNIIFLVFIHMTYPGI